MLLNINNLHTSIEGKALLQGFSLSIAPGTVHALMGPNGAGKSSLAMVLMGHPAHIVTTGTITFNGDNLLTQKPHERARAGLFLSFQNPIEIDGLPVRDLLRQTHNALYEGDKNHLDLENFTTIIESYAQQLGLDTNFLDRSFNVGFSGGERKRVETLQLLVQHPKLVILDELDSGLDIDALNAVSEGIKILRKESPQASFLIITHYPRLLEKIRPDLVHIMRNGHIVQTGDASLSQKIEKEGYGA